MVKTWYAAPATNHVCSARIRSSISKSVSIALTLRWRRQARFYRIVPPIFAVFRCSRRVCLIRSAPRGSVLCTYSFCLIPAFIPPPNPSTFLISCNKLLPQSFRIFPSLRGSRFYLKSLILSKLLAYCIIVVLLLLQLFSFVLYFVLSTLHVLCSFVH